MPSFVGIVKKTNEILRIVQSVALGVCFSIYNTSMARIDMHTYTVKLVFTIQHLIVIRMDMTTHIRM